MKQKTKDILLKVFVGVTVALALTTSIMFGIVGHWLAIFENLIDGSGVFWNNLDTRVSQTELYDAMWNHMNNNNSGKTPMLLFVGYEGVTADMVLADIERPENPIAELSATGGLYLGQAGVNQGTDTATGWTTLLTGKWGDETGVTNNSGVMKEDVHTIMWDFEKEGISSSISYSRWLHKLKTQVFKYESQVNPDMFKTCEDEDAVLASAQVQIETNTRANFAIFKQADIAAHYDGGFRTDNPAYVDGFRKAQIAAREMILQVNKRMTLDSEDWLIIITTNHGGFTSFHGGHTLLETTTFFASNKEIFGPKAA